MRPSECSLSDELNELLMLKEEIDNTILDREKIGLIQDASFQYNSLARMASPAYYTEMEESAMRHIAQEWNELIVAENENLRGQPIKKRENGELDDITYNIDDDLGDFLKDLFNNIGDNYDGLFDDGEEK